MAVGDRNKHLRVAAELLQVHLPAHLGDHDQALLRDLLSVLGMTIRAAYEDAERSAEAWDKKAYHVKADQLRDEWAWAPGAANYADGLAYRGITVTAHHLEQLARLVRPRLELSGRRVIHDVEAFRGAAAANRERQDREQKRRRARR